MISRCFPRPCVRPFVILGEAKNPWGDARAEKRFEPPAGFVVALRMTSHGLKDPLNSEFPRPAMQGRERAEDERIVREERDRRGGAATAAVYLRAGELQVHIVSGLQL